ncbi:MAG: class I SAM-dependent methyltransferase [Cyclobacteriaceae bacterium]|nr:class I SAM-dependent methyltransferase [Cyclobacteriaceae bacterium]UYN86298.1 MAG: class I SAM-dependent methyltransferase [Cyclobacteriaceae bacterium]
MTKEFWNNRYTEHDTVYGDQPSQFFKGRIQQLTPGRLLLPAEGEGRNAIFAAQAGWQVDAFDYSSVAALRALERASKNGVAINYTVQEIEFCSLPKNTYDVIGLIYVHLMPGIRAAFHAQCVSALKQGGTLILEGFSKEQLHFSSGGPKNEAMLYSNELLVDDFQGLQVTKNTLEMRVLNDGPFHQGKAAIIYFAGVKV